MKIKFEEYKTPVELKLKKTPKEALEYLLQVNQYAMEGITRLMNNDVVTKDIRIGLEYALEFMVDAYNAFVDYNTEG